MRINAKKLLTFIEKATLKGSIPTALFRIKDNAMYAYNLSTDNAVGVYATLSNIEEENQAWAIKNTKMLIELLKLFEEEIEIKKTSNKLVILDAIRQVEYVLADEEFITNAKETLSKVVHENVDVISSNIFKNALRNKKIVETNKVRFVVENGTLYVDSGNDSFDTITEKISTTLPNAKLYLGNVANDVFANLDDNVELGLKTDYPVSFRFTTKDYSVQYIVAHLQVNDDV